MEAAALPAGFLSTWSVNGAHSQLLLAEPPVTGAEVAAPALQAAPNHAAQDAGAPYGPAVERVASCAVSLAFLTDFIKRCVAPLEERDGTLLTTKDVVERLIIPVTKAAVCTFASLVPAAVARPTAFASHAFGNPFRLLVSALEEHFMNAVTADVYIWVDIFAINQHDPGADLHGGKALARTIELVGETLVVLDRKAFPLTRLWCLYEMGSTPPDKLRLLTPGFREADLVAAYRAVNVDAAECFDSKDTSRIREHIVTRYGSLAAFQQMLRLRLLLKPTSYEADRAVFLARNTDTWCFEELRAFLSSAGGESRLACIVGGPGEGKSTLAAALCDPSLAQIHAHHFCKASDVRRQDVDEVIRSLSYQLALRFPSFGEALFALEQADVESLSDPTRAWELLLKQPLSLLRGMRVVVLFDALDEAGGTDTSISNVLSLVLDLGRITDGAAISVIVTTRPEAGIIAALRGRWRSNARDFLPAALRDGGEQIKLLALLQKERPGMSFVSVDTAYTTLFDKALTARPNPAVVRFLSILMAARQPPSMALLEELGVRSACTALPGWGLLFQEREHCVHMLHKSLAEWLQDASRSGPHAVDVGVGHRAWADLLSSQLRAWLDTGTPELAPPRGSYAYAHFLPHLDASGRNTEAKATLMRLPWLQATLRERGLYALLGDVASRKVAGDGTLSLLHQTLRLAAPGLQVSDAADVLPGQLVGRLGGLRDTSAAAELRQLYQAAHDWQGTVAWLRPLKASLEPPGPLELRLYGHWVDVVSLLALADGRVVSASWDKTLRVWNTATGECERTLEGHSDRVDFLIALAGGRVVSGARDATLRVWHIATGECERVLEGHTSMVTCLVALADDRAVSGSVDKMLRVWNAATGDCEHVLHGHTGEVTSLVALADGRVVSGSEDNTLRVWNATTGICERTLEGHTDAVVSLTTLADGRVVSASADKTLCVWNAATGNREGILENVCSTGTPLPMVTIGSRIICRSAHRTLGVWNCVTGECEHILEGHTAGVKALVLADDRVVSASADMTLRVWNAATGVCERTLKGHELNITALTALADGRVVSASMSGPIIVWNIAATSDGARTVDGHTKWVTSLLALADGRVLSGSGDKTLRVWNAATGICERVLEGHTKAVKSLASLPDGRVVSGSADQTLRVWSTNTGECEFTLEGHDWEANRVAILLDGRILSESNDGTVRAWNADTGRCDVVVSRKSSEAAALLSLPRFGEPKSLYTTAGYGSMITGLEVAPTYVGSLTKVVATTCGDKNMVVASSTTGEIHFFTLRPPR